MIRALIYWIAGGVVTLLLFITAVIGYFLSGQNTRFPHIISRVWSRVLLFLCGVKIKIKGLENIHEGKNYIIVSNHRSQVDIFVASASIPLQFRWLAKKSLFKLPIIGYGMKICGYIPVEREKRYSAGKSLTAVKNVLADGKSVWIFPEGTRTRKEELGRFKRGAFQIALDTGIPILPVVMVNTDKVFISPVKVKPATIYVDILEPVEVDKLINKYNDIFKNERDKLEFLIKEVRDKIQAVYQGYESKLKQ